MTNKVQKMRGNWDIITTCDRPNTCPINYTITRPQYAVRNGIKVDIIETNKKVNKNFKPKKRKG